MAITLPTDNRVIGMIGCRVREHAADVGYVLGATFWGQEYMTEAARTIVDWLCGIESVYRVWPCVMWRITRRHGF